MTDEKFDSDINFSKVLFLHLNRIAQNVKDTDLLLANIDIFEIFLCPYIDIDYEKDMKTTSQKSASVASLDSLTKGKDNMMRNNMINNSMHKFRCLMKLAERKHLLLPEKITGEDEDEE